MAICCLPITISINSVQISVLRSYIDRAVRSYYSGRIYRAFSLESPLQF